jgi:hypothetical protein
MSTTPPEPTQACQACAAALQRPHSGSYQMSCITCCTRLVKSAQPLEHAVQAMLHIVEKHHGSAGREQVQREIQP